MDNRRWIVTNPRGVGKSWFEQMRERLERGDIAMPSPFDFQQTWLAEQVEAGVAEMTRRMQQIPEAERRALLHGDWSAFEDDEPIRPRPFIGSRGPHVMYGQQHVVFVDTALPDTDLEPCLGGVDEDYQGDAPALGGGRATH